MMKHAINPALALLFALCAGSAAALDLGTIGPTFPIIEKDMIEMMKGKLSRMEKSGDLAKLNERYKNEVIGAVENPRAVPGIRATETARSFYIDPTYTLDRNVVDANGAILYPAGTKVNPFDYAPMTQYLIFFDQRDKSQVEFAKRFIENSKIRVKPILVAGSPMKLMREWKREVFFDQGGALSRRFQIKQTPAIVSQDNKRLRVDEIRL